MSGPPARRRRTRERSSGACEGHRVGHSLPAEGLGDGDAARRQRVQTVSILSNKRKWTTNSFCDPELSVSHLSDRSNFLSLTLTISKGRTEIYAADLKVKF